jgi:ADP-ribose pyrophosphatase YjhB (NUDIX family)
MAAARKSIPHFVTGAFTSHATFLPDETYATVLDNVVKGCTDILLVHDGKVLVGKRGVFPQKSWWFGCGGRLKPGETPGESTNAT